MAGVRRKHYLDKATVRILSDMSPVARFSDGQKISAYVKRDLSEYAQKVGVLRQLMEFRVL